MAYSFEDHTAEVMLRLSAPDFAGLLVEAGKALAELLTDERPTTGAGAGAAEETPERVSLQATDRPALLVHWINELIFLSETRKRVYSEFDVLNATEHEVQALTRGFPVSTLRTQVKAATFHRLSLKAGPEGFQAEVVLDV